MRTASELVDQNERVVGAVLHDVGRLLHLAHERRRVIEHVIVGAHATEDAIGQTEACELGRDEATWDAESVS